MSLTFTKPQEQPKHDLTVYPEKYNPLPSGPADQHKSLSWIGVVDTLAPGDSPALIHNKDRNLYFTLGLLSDGELTNYASKELSALAGYTVTHGRARCISCCQGPFNLLAYDIDGVSPESFSACMKRLDECGVDYLIFSTFSFGCAEKPEVRFRLIIRLADELSVAQYQQAHDELAASLLSDVRSGIDKSSRSPSQQQGVWATRPELAKHAFKFYRADGVCLSSSSWLNADSRSHRPSVPRPLIRPPVRQLAAGENEDVLTSGLRRALCIIPSRTRYFHSLLMYLKAIDGVVDAYELFEFWAWLDPEHQAEQQGRRAAYDPAIAWANAKPVMEIAAAIGSIHKLARECAQELVLADPGLRQPNANEAARYLFVWHRKHFLALKDQLGNRDQTSEQGTDSVDKEAA
jgi:hypothetical protein